MDKMEIENGNRIIAEFMGIKIQTINSVEYMPNNYQDENGERIEFYRWALYHTSWDWLMPVVEKIAKNYDIRIAWYDRDCACFISSQTVEGDEIVSRGNFEPAIHNVWLAVIDFIKYYNSLNQQQ